MQYIEYQYAKDNKIIGQVIYLWMKKTPYLSLETRGYAIQDWRDGKCLMNIGETNPGFVDEKVLNEWSKQQANPKFHNEAYQKAYLKGYFKL